MYPIPASFGCFGRAGVFRPIPAEIKDSAGMYFVFASQFTSDQRRRRRRKKKKKHKIHIYIYIIVILKR